MVEAEMAAALESEVDMGMDAEEDNDMVGLVC